MEAVRLSSAYISNKFEREVRPVTHERILVVDDAANIREVLAHQILASEGYDVITAKSAQEAFVLALDLQPDLIISDYMMPGMTGLDLIEELHNADLQIPFILITAEGSETLAIQALRAGVSDYLTKPFTADDILTSISNVMSHYWTAQIREKVSEHLRDANRLLEARLEELSTLVAIGKSVTSMLDVQDVLNQVVDAAVQVTGAEESSLLLTDRSTSQLYMRAARNFDQKTVHTLRLPMQDSIAGQVVRSGHPVVLNNEEIIKIKTSYLVKAIIYVPLRIKQKVVGVLSVDNRYSNREFSPQDVQLLSILADFAAVAIENTQLYAEISHERDTLDAILRDTEDRIIVVDAEDKVLFCNPTARETFKVTTTDFIGKPVKDVVQNQEVLALFSKEPLSGRGRHSEITVNDGEVILNAQLTIINGVGRALVMQDITHLKAINKAKSDFVTAVSHDLRSPLTGILAYVELMQRVGTLNSAQQEYAQQITRSIQSISSLITELLELGKIETGYDVDFAPVDLRDIVQETLDNLSPQLRTKGHTVEIDCATDLPRVHGNPLRLRQVTANLIGNAIKYTPDQGLIRVEVCPEDGLVMFRVIDNGIGIPIEDQPYVFDKFYRTAQASKDFEGTGLGLAIVKSIIDQHNGRIWLESREGQGTTFTVVLPVTQD